MIYGFALRAPSAAALFAFVLLAAGAGSAFTVNSVLDPGDGTCDDAECTLREAIGAVNTTNKKGVIDFDPAVFVMGTPGIIEPGLGLGTALPVITRSNVTIDGSGAGVVIDGTGLIGVEDGLVVQSGAGINLSKVTVMGVTIRGFPGHGLVVCGGEAPACADDVSKVTLDDLVAHDNDGSGILVTGARNTSTRVTGSTVHGNLGWGMRLSSDLALPISKARVSGCTARSNGVDGILVNGASDNTRTQIEDSVASGNGGQGIELNAGDRLDKATVKNTTASFNGSQGVLLNAGDEQLRSKISDSRFAANSGDGLDLNAGGKLERAKLTNNTAQSNGGNGLRLNSATEVLRAKLTGNVVSDSQEAGIRLEGSRNNLKQNVSSANLLEGIFLDEAGDKSKLQKNETHGNGTIGVRVATPNARNNVKKNRALGNPDGDLIDENPSCGSNKWTKNTFTAGNAPCIE